MDSPVTRQQSGDATKNEASNSELFRFNEQPVTKVMFNNQEVKSLFYNGVKIF